MAELLKIVQQGFKPIYNIETDLWKTYKVAIKIENIEELIEVMKIRDKYIKSHYFMSIEDMVKFTKEHYGQEKHMHMYEEGLYIYFDDPDDPGCLTVDYGEDILERLTTMGYSTFVDYKDIILE